jgi:hypothetical protein
MRGHPHVREDRLVRWTDATRPVTGAVSLALRAERGARRALGQRAEDAALATLDALLASRVGAEAVDRVLESDLAGRAVGKVLEGPLVEAVARDVVRYAVLERVLDDAELERVLVAALDSPAAERLLARVLESKFLDEAVRRLLEGEELWLVVDEIAQSPAVTEAITRQSIGFADQVAGGVRGRSRNADAWLERAARRALRRPPQ